MPMFGRKHAQTTTVADPAVPASHRHEDSQHLSIGGFFRLYWTDLLTMAALGAVGLGVYFAPRE